MKTLALVRPTPEQLPIIQNAKPGVCLIRGAAGSGKTTTAILRLKQLAGFWLARRIRLNNPEPVRILVITFNRTLRGYIAELVAQQTAGKQGLQLTVSTFAKWAKNLAPKSSILEDSVGQSKLMEFCRLLPLASDFLVGEVGYVQGRFPPDELDKYLSCNRDGRGAMPRMERILRQQILSEIIRPYTEWKRSVSKLDWNDLATLIVAEPPPVAYDVIIVDESQDLSANEVRALMHCAADPSSVTFVLDAAQRIYPRGFTWKEAGVPIQSSDSFRLGTNHRNTIEICQFALPLLKDMDIGDDGTFPDFNSCIRHGPKPLVIKGKYSEQANYVTRYLNNVDLSRESVAFLKPKGGAWFDFIKRVLASSNREFVDITRQSDWPQSSSNIALSTMNSAKGLEFDHVIILGLSNGVTIHEPDPQDSTLHNLRRLLAMAITRARSSVILGYKPAEKSRLISYLDPLTYDEISL